MMVHGWTGRIVFGTYCFACTACEQLYTTIYYYIYIGRIVTLLGLTLSLSLFVMHVYDNDVHMRTKCMYVYVHICHIIGERESIASHICWAGLYLRAFMACSSSIRRLANMAIN